MCVSSDEIWPGGYGNRVKDVDSLQQPGFMDVFLHMQVLFPLVWPPLTEMLQFKKLLCFGHRLIEEPFDFCADSPNFFMQLIKENLKL